MTMYIKTNRIITAAPIQHPIAKAIEALEPPKNIHEVFLNFHDAIKPDGYRIGVKYLDAGIYIPRGSFIGRSSANTKDPIHVLFPKFRPAPHPTDPKYPTPPISFQDTAACLKKLQEQQTKFKLFEHTDSSWGSMGWPSKVDPFRLSYHSSNIYVTPLSASYYYLSIDDVDNPQKKETLDKMGIKPALVITSSITENNEDNEQWIIKIPKLPQFCQSMNLINHFAAHLPKPIDDPAIRKLAQNLNQLAGDSQVTSCTRDFRLPGFYQLKKKYVEKGIFHTVSIKHAIDIQCQVTQDMYHELYAKLEKVSKKQVKPIQKQNQFELPMGDVCTSYTSESQKTGAIAPAHINHDDFYPDNQKYMIHALDVQAWQPKDPKFAPRRNRNKFYVLQRLIATGSLAGIDQTTPLFQDAQLYLSDNIKSHMYIYLRLESQIVDYQDETPIQSESFNAHYVNAYKFFEDHKKSVQAACRRMFYCRHSRSCIERTLIFEGCEPAQALEYAKKGCCPSNQQIKKDSSHLSVWEKIEKAAARNRQEAKVTRCVPKIKAQ